MNLYSVFYVVLAILAIGDEANCAGSRKKIRIHIPQKVKHIHHHKKIYITKHMAQPTQFLPQYANSDHYAAAYLSPTSELAASVAPTIAFLPVAEGRKSTASGSSPAPNLQPLYRARGHYGPPTQSTTSKRIVEVRPSSSTKKIKVIKISDSPKKTIILKKPKRIVIQAAGTNSHDEKENNPLSPYHEQFYADLKATDNTFKTVRKPKRVEKYVDGNTEHIHTYSEEHIHQIVYDDPPADSNKLGEPLDVAVHASMPQVIHAPISTPIVPSMLPALQATAATHLHPIDSIFGPMPTVGSLGTPTHYEYMHYDPHDTTHDHMLHDHGELTTYVPSAFKAPYSLQQIKINPSFNLKDVPAYDGQWVSQDVPIKLGNSQPDYSYYENFYKHKQHKKQHGKHGNELSKKPNYEYNYKPKESKKLKGVDSNYYKFKDESLLGDYGSLYSEPIRQHQASYYGTEYRKKPKSKPSSYASSYYGHSGSKTKGTNSLKQHHYHKVADNKPYSTAASFYDNHSYGGFKDNKGPNKFKHYTNIYGSTSPLKGHDSDAFASSDYKHEDSGLPLSWRNKKNKSKKSISTQNISFGGQEHKMVINHETSIAIGGAETRVADSDLQESSPKPTAVVATFSPIDTYYGALAKAYGSQSNIPEASNTNFHIVEAPRVKKSEKAAPSEVPPSLEISSTRAPSSTTTTTTTTQRPVTEILEHLRPNKAVKKPKKKNAEKKPKVRPSEPHRTIVEPPKAQPSRPSPSGRGKYKYGDRLNERYDYEYDELIFV